MSAQPTSATRTGGITAWSAVSPFGIGRERLAAGLRRGTTAAAPLDQSRWPAPMGTACLVPDFSAAAQLGAKGTRSMDRATALAVVTVAQLLEEARQRGIEVDEQAALVLGTSTGSVQSIMSFTRDSLTRTRPYLVNPAEFPNTVMNCAAGQCAIWHRLRGPNATIAAGRASGLVALNYALRLQRSGQADSVLCGAVEEFSAMRAWLDHHAHARHATKSVLGEGCALLLLQAGAGAGARGGANARTPAPEVLALELGLACEESAIERVLALCIGRALKRARLRTEQVELVAPSCEHGSQALAESNALLHALGDGERGLVSTVHALGEQHAASAIFQVVACLEAERAPGTVALVTSVDGDGFVGCALLRTS